MHYPMPRRGQVAPKVPSRFVLRRLSIVGLIDGFNSKGLASLVSRQHPSPPLPRPGLCPMAFIGE